MDRERLLSEVAWQEQQLKSLERDWRRLPFVGLLGLLAIPAGYVWGGFGVFVELVGTVVIALVSAYVIHGHRTDYEERLRALKRQLNNEATR